MNETLPTYLTSARSLQILTRAVGSRDTAILLLSDALRGGIIPARGWAKEDHMKRVRPVPVAVWRDANDSDQRRWSWAGGAFSCSSRDLLTVGGCDWEDVQFSTVGILDLCEEHGDPANLESGASEMSGQASRDVPYENHTDTLPRMARGGNPGKVEAWHRFWVEAMTLLDEGALADRERFPTQRSLIDELRGRIDNALSEESVKPQVSKIWVKFVAL